jgi:hypothetical protein
VDKGVPVVCIVACLHAAESRCMPHDKLRRARFGLRYLLNN